MAINKWQRIYLNYYYKGNMPRSETGLVEFLALANIKDKIVVHYPEHHCCEGHTSEFLITPFDNSLCEGRISVPILAENLVFWRNHGYKVETL